MKNFNKVITALTITLTITSFALVQSASANSVKAHATPISESAQVAEQDPCETENAQGVECSFMEFEEEVIEVSLPAN